MHSHSDQSIVCIQIVVVKSKLIKIKYVLAASQAIQSVLVDLYSTSQCCATTISAVFAM
jgi:hypothetical protein